MCVFSIVETETWLLISTVQNSLRSSMKRWFRCLKTYSSYAQKVSFPQRRYEKAATVAQLCPELNRIYTHPRYKLYQRFGLLPGRRILVKFPDNQTTCSMAHNLCLQYANLGLGFSALTKRCVSCFSFIKFLDFLHGSIDMHVELDFWILEEDGNYRESEIEQRVRAGRAAQTRQQKRDRKEGLTRSSTERENSGGDPDKSKP